jgi:MFS family permease
MAYTNSSVSRFPAPPANYKLQNTLLLLVAGLGGLLYGVDVGIIGGALPYLEATSGLTAGELSVIVAAVLLGSVFSTLFAGLLADWMGRKPLMTLSGITFVISIPVIALSHGYGPLFFGRLLQGISGGLIGVVVPLYLAECLASSVRGKGTAVFQWLLTLGIVVAAFIGIYYSYRVEAMEHIANASAVFHFKDEVWRRIFWVSLPPGVLFVCGTLLVAESPRWLFRGGKVERARLALMRSRNPQEVEIEIREMQETAMARQTSSGKKIKDSRFCSPASSCSATRQLESIQSSVTTPTSSCRVDFPTFTRTGATSFSRW